MALKELIYDLVNAWRPCSLVQRILVEHEELKKEYAASKQILEASKARNKILSAEMKILKDQVSTLLQKDKHDDELVDSLLVRN